MQLRRVSNITLLCMGGKVLGFKSFSLCIFTVSPMLTAELLWSKCEDLCVNVYLYARLFCDLYVERRCRA